jgi:hypothetical protein
MIEAAILAAMSPAQERAWAWGLEQLAPWIYFGVGAAYAHVMGWWLHNPLLAMGVVLLLLGFFCPLKLPGDKNQGDVELGVFDVKAKVGGNARTFIMAGGLLIIAWSLWMMSKAMFAS